MQSVRLAKVVQNLSVSPALQATSSSPRIHALRHALLKLTSKLFLTKTLTACHVTIVVPTVQALFLLSVLIVGLISTFSKTSARRVLQQSKA